MQEHTREWSAGRVAATAALVLVILHFGVLVADAVQPYFADLRPVFSYTASAWLSVGVLAVTLAVGLWYRKKLVVALCVFTMCFALLAHPTYGAGLGERANLAVFRSTSLHGSHLRIVSMDPLGADYVRVYAERPLSKPVYSSTSDLTAFDMRSNDATIASHCVLVGTRQAWDTRNNGLVDPDVLR